MLAGTQNASYQAPELYIEYKNANMASIYERVSSLDSVSAGAGRHMFFNKGSFVSYSEQVGPLIEMANNNLISSTGEGTSTFTINGKLFQTTNALHVPGLGKNRFSVGQSTAIGIKYLFDGNEMIIYVATGFQRPIENILATVTKDHDNIYRMNCSISDPSKIPGSPEITASDAPLKHHESVTSHAKHWPKTTPASFVKQNGTVTETIVHERLGHFNLPDVRRLIHKSAKGLRCLPNYRMQEQCEPFILAKIKREPFPLSAN